MNLSRFVKISIVTSMLAMGVIPAAFADAKYPGSPGINLEPVVIKTLVIPFKNDDSRLSASQIGIIRNAAKLQNTKFNISGYASKAGDAKYNLRLSKIRARAIESQILTIQPNAKTFAKGFGEVTNEACTKSENRCVVVTVIERN